MTELHLYLVLVSSAIVGSTVGVASRRENRNFVNLASYITLLFCYAAFVVVSRAAGFDTDLKKFVGWLSADFFGFFVAREYLFFFLGRLFYNLTNSNVGAILCLDALWILCIALGVRRWRLANRIDSSTGFATFSAILVSFIFIMGSQNFYRQHLALAVAVLAYSMLQQRKYTGIGIFLSAILFHNSVALLAPIFVFRYFTKFGYTRAIVYFFLALLILMALLTLLGMGGLSELQKSNASTGLDLRAAYFIIFFIITVFGLVKCQYNYRLWVQYFHATISGFALIGTMAIYFNDAAVERMAMIFLTFSIFELQVSLKNEHQLVVLVKNPMVVIFLSLPVLLFYNARQFLMT